MNPCYSSQKVFNDLEVTGESSTIQWAPKVTVITIGDSPFALDDEVILICDTSGGSINVNLPALSSVTDRVYNIKQKGASSVTVRGNGEGASAEKIDGASRVTIRQIYTSITIVDGISEWSIF